MFPDCQTNAVHLSDRLPEAFPRLYADLIKILADHRIPVHEIPDTRDIWCRDYMPVQVAANGFVQFVYKPDYLVAKRFQGALTGPDAGRRVVPAPELDTCEIILDGGNLVRWGEEKVILSEAVFRMNPKFDREWILAQLREMLQVERLIFIPVEARDTTGRANAIMRFADECTVVVNDYTMVNQIYGKKLEKVLCGAGIKFIKVPFLPRDVGTQGIPPALGNHMQFLQTCGLIVLPVYGGAGEERVIRLFEETFTKVSIVALECAELALLGGALDAIAWSVYAPATVPMIGKCF